MTPWATCRNHLGEKLGLIDQDEFRFVWVTHFPMFEYDETEKRYQATHHPFTSPLEEDCDRLETDPLSVNSRAYDMVLNGIGNRRRQHPYPSKGFADPDT